MSNSNHEREDLYGLTPKDRENYLRDEQNREMVRRKRVILESPYKGNSYEDLETNLAYARRAMRDALLRNEAPFLSHLLYTQEGVLDDTIESERQLGIDAGLVWSEASDYSVIYVDRGISKGMNYGIVKALNNGKDIYFRSLEGKNLTYDLLVALGFQSNLSNFYSGTLSTIDSNQGSQLVHVSK